MPLPLPNLDDRTFTQLLAEARRVVTRTAPEWNDLSAGDPGMVLLELYAYLTETMIYRLNRLPDKVYIAFLRLLGVTPHPPAAARVTLRFSRATAAQSLDIPRGTRVTVGRPGGGEEPPIFITGQTVSLAAGETEVEVLAFHATQVEGELLGRGTGLPGLSLTVRRPPLIAPTGDQYDLLIGVESLPEELDEQAPARQFNNKSYRLWRAVDNFTNLGPDRYVYVADRSDGTIIFAPAARLAAAAGELAETAVALAAIPPAGREIRAWYRTGGGPEGNVNAHTLTVLKDTIPGLEVTNPRPATGGQAAESLPNALVRGPQELHSLQRAVTARDFELLAMNSSRGVARARALTQADLWRHALPGTAEILLVPHLPENERNGRISAESLRQRQAAEVRQQIQQALDERRPLGTICRVSWAHYKTVRVLVRIVVGHEEDQAAVKARVLDRLYQTISPLPTGISATGWPFGQSLRVSDVYSVALAEPGVRWVDRVVRLLVDETPAQHVTALAADHFQPHTWYAASSTDESATLFRSMNDGEGWEAIGRFTQEPIAVIEPHPQRAGLVAMATATADGGSRIHVSADCGENWQTVTHFAFAVTDLAWTLRGSTPLLLLATERGLYELLLVPNGSPVQLMVDRQDQDRGLYAVATAVDVRGGVSVIVSSQNLGGVYLSSDGGRSGTFRAIGLSGEDIRQLAVQYDGPRAFLWAGATVAGGNDPGNGCFRWELRGSEDAPEGWRHFGRGWNGGSCRGIGFVNGRILAASHRAGVLRLDPRREAGWQTPDVRCGLPLRDPGRFHPVETIATNPAGTLLLVGNVEGVYGSRDGEAYTPSASEEFLDRVTLPETWLFVSGEHDVTVVTEGDDEA